MPEPKPNPTSRPCRRSATSSRGSSGCAAAARQPPAPERRPTARRPARRALFRWECGPSGEISWVEGAPRGPLIGRSIARVEEGEGVDEEVERAFAMRAPFRDARFSLPGEGALAGDWKISGVPAFEPSDGRFAGYRGIALREGGPGPDPSRIGQSSLLSDPNSLRELVHEIKTPLNAIIGFAEIIDGQYLGPADRHYRDARGGDRRPGAAAAVGDRRPRFRRQAAVRPQPAGQRHRPRHAARADRRGDAPGRRGQRAAARAGGRAPASAAARSSRRWPSGW